MSNTPDSALGCPTDKVGGFMIVVIGLVLAFVLIVIFANRRTRACRWRAVKSGDKEGQSLFRCTACGAEVLTQNGRAPDTCHIPPRKESK